VLAVVGIVLGWVVLVAVLASTAGRSPPAAPAAAPAVDSTTPAAQRLDNTTRHCLDTGVCYLFRNYGYSCASCLAVNGTFTNNMCYHNAFNCSSYSVDGHCFASRRPTTSRHCAEGEYGHEHYCYYTDIPDCDGGFHVNCACYKFNSTTYTYQTCQNIRGYYAGGVIVRSTVTNYINGTCYYNMFNCSTAFPVNGQCYLNRNTNYTRGTCRNIDGYIDEADSTTNATCYNSGFKCPFMSAGGECFRSSVPVNLYMHSRRSGNAVCSSCVNTGGVYRNGYCLYYDEFVGRYGYGYGRAMPNCSYYRVMDRCETTNETMANSTECEAVDGYYNQREGNCYYTPFTCPNYTAECRCYSNKSTEFTRGTCQNIGGSYDSSQITCYYNSNHCPFYRYRQQCYERRLRQPQFTSCEGAYDTYNGVCYNNPYRYSPF
jgi:hypothetical protein